MAIPDNARNPPTKRHLWPTTILPRRLDLAQKSSSPACTLAASASTAQARASSMQLVSSRRRCGTESGRMLSHTHDITKAGASGTVGAFHLQGGVSTVGPASLTAMTASPGSTMTRAGHSVHSAHSANVSSGALSVTTAKSAADVQSPLTHSTVAAPSGVSAADGPVNDMSRGSPLAFSPPPGTPLAPQLSQSSTVSHGLHRITSHQGSLNMRAARSSSISDGSQSRTNTTSAVGLNAGALPLCVQLFFEQKERVGVELRSMATCDHPIFCVCYLPVPRLGFATHLLFFRVCCEKATCNLTSSTCSKCFHQYHRRTCCLHGVGCNTLQFYFIVFVICRCRFPSCVGTVQWNSCQHV